MRCRLICCFIALSFDGFEKRYLYNIYYTGKREKSSRDKGVIICNISESLYFSFALDVESLKKLQKPLFVSVYAIDFYRILDKYLSCSIRFCITTF